MNSRHDAGGSWNLEQELEQQLEQEKQAQLIVITKQFFPENGLFQLFQPKMDIRVQEHFSKDLFITSIIMTLIKNTRMHVSNISWNIWNIWNKYYKYLYNKGFFMPILFQLVFQLSVPTPYRSEVTHV